MHAFHISGGEDPGDLNLGEENAVALIMGQNAPEEYQILLRFDERLSSVSLDAIMMNFGHVRESPSYRYLGAHPTFKLSRPTHVRLTVFMMPGANQTKGRYVTRLTSRYQRGSDELAMTDRLHAIYGAAFPARTERIGHVASGSFNPECIQIW